MGSHALLLLPYIRMGVCNLCYAFRNSPRPRCSVLELAISMADMRSVSKANGRESATWNTSLLDLLLVYSVASHRSIFKTIIIKALKWKPSAQFAHNYTINVSSKCSNIFSHRSSIFEGRHIDRQSSKVDTSIFEGRHIDLRRLEGRNIAPTTQHRTDIPTIRHRILSTTALHNYYT